MSKHSLMAFFVGVAACALVGWMRGGGASPRQVLAESPAVPETQAPKVNVNEIGVHSMIEGGAHAHDGRMTAEQWEAEQAAHQKAELEIFGRPGGLYTQADIDRNGPLSPAKKFARIHARHDLKTKKGDRICPITETRANEAFHWWIGGKRYTFCCPPCVEELVMQAKKRPGSIKPPESYVKR